MYKSTSENVSHIKYWCIGQRSRPQGQILYLDPIGDVGDVGICENFLILQYFLIYRKLNFHTNLNSK